MIFKIPYWTHSAIVFDKCHKKVIFAQIESKQQVILAEMIETVFGRQEKFDIYYQHFSLLIMFSKAFSDRVVQTMDYLKEGIRRNFQD